MDTTTSLQEIPKAYEPKDVEAKWIRAWEDLKVFHADPTSAKPPYALYAGAQVLFRTTDKGQHWATISPDLTGAREGAKHCDGDVPVANATACGYGVIYSIAPSPRTNDEIWIGTDNGLIQTTADGGAHWRNVTPNNIPKWSKIASLDLSLIKGVLCDCEMVRAGIIRRYLPPDTELILTLNDPTVPALAKSLGTTRSAAAVELWRPYLEGSIVVIGNAPTALFHLLEMLDAGAPKPAAVIGIPVGFIGAAESKDALARDGRVPYLVVHGRRGGSAMAAAAVNALANPVE